MMTRILMNIMMNLMNNLLKSYFNNHKTLIVYINHVLLGFYLRQGV